AQTARMSGRARDGRLVHFTAVAAPGTEIDAEAIRPGDLVTVQITDAAPYHLIADAGVQTHRRTRAGDAYADGMVARPRPVGVGLGMQRRGAPPSPVPVAVGCGYTATEPRGTRRPAQG